MAIENRSLLASADADRLRPGNERVGTSETMGHGLLARRPQEGHPGLYSKIWVRDGAAGQSEPVSVDRFLQINGVQPDRRPRPRRRTRPGRDQTLREGQHDPTHGHDPLQRECRVGHQWAVPLSAAGRSRWPSARGTRDGTGPPFPVGVGQPLLAGVLTPVVGATGRVPCGAIVVIGPMSSAQFFFNHSATSYAERSVA